MAVVSAGHWKVTNHEAGPMVYDRSGNFPALLLSVTISGLVTNLDAITTLLDPEASLTLRELLFEVRPPVPPGMLEVTAHDDPEPRFIPLLRPPEGPESSDNG